MASAELTEETKELSEQAVESESLKGPEERFKLEPTKESAEEIVKKIFSQVSDEGIRKSMERMGELENELKTKIEKMQSSFTELYQSMVEDIEKFKAIDKSYESAKSDSDSQNTGEKPLSDEISKVGENVDELSNEGIAMEQSENISSSRDDVMANDEQMTRNGDSAGDNQHVAQEQVDANKDTKTGEPAQDLNGDASKGKGKKKKKKGVK